jgi:acyl-CoA thioesterase-1
MRPKMSMSATMVMRRAQRTSRLVVAYVLLAALVWPLSAFAQGAPVPRDILIVALGDSLTAGYQLAPSESFPAQLEQALREKGYAVRVQNAGVSGDTTADALARLNWIMPDDAEGVIVELGANDALRGFPVAQMRRSLDAIMSELTSRGLPVLIAGMEAPRNYGPDYTQAFAEVYRDMAETHGALLYPFFLEGVALQPELNLPDGIHPKAEGVAIIVANILPSVEKLIERIEARRAGIL